VRLGVKDSAKDLTGPSLSGPHADMHHQEIIILVHRIIPDMN
jgi:hypothetical protein